jgi:hypothetical protein
MMTPIMAWRPVTRRELRNLTWSAADEGGWRIGADLTCDRCGAYQAVDSDPTTQKERAVELATRLLGSVGWRVNEAGEVACPNCAAGGRGSDE